MTLQEFSSEFDILYNNIMSNQAPGLDEYEKSVFLTKAQEDTVVDLYTGKTISGSSFENTEELRRYLSDLNKSAKLSSIEDTSDKIKLSELSTFYMLPKDVLFITYEAVDFVDDDKCLNKKNILVYPTTRDDYHRIKSNPFRKANHRRVLRLDYEGNIVELVSEYNIKEYTIKYLAIPSPIILEDLPEGISINGESTETPCKLNPVLHRAILDRAVRLAYSSFINAGNN